MAENHWCLKNMLTKNLDKIEDCETKDCTICDFDKQRNYCKKPIINKSSKKLSLPPTHTHINQCMQGQENSLNAGLLSPSSTLTSLIKNLCKPCQKKVNKSITTTTY